MMNANILNFHVNVFVAMALLMMSTEKDLIGKMMKGLTKMGIDTKVLLVGLFFIVLLAIMNILRFVFENNMRNDISKIRNEILSKNIVKHSSRINPYDLGEMGEAMKRRARK